jgi:5-methylcytosine-specific restriction endonuclease McrA
VIKTRSGRASYTRPTSRRVLRGYARSRQRYDAKRDRAGRSAELRGWVALLQTEPCAYCNGFSRGEANSADHIVSLQNGGVDAWDNLSSTCRSCNGGKREMSMLSFMLKRNG